MLVFIRPRDVKISDTSEIASYLYDGFDAQNVARIYHGEPALAAGRLPADILDERQFRVAAYCADGLTYVEAAEVLERPDVNVLDDLRVARERLGVIDTFQLAGYFPLAPHHPAIGDKKLADLEGLTYALNILEAISIGKRNRQVAAAVGITNRLVKDRVSDIEEVWEDVESGLMLTRVANTIRARYVQAIETQPGSIKKDRILKLALPILGKLEPRIEREFLKT